MNDSSTVTGLRERPGASYGNWVPARSPGLGSLSFLGTTAAVLAIVAALTAFTIAGPRAGAMWASYGLLVFLGVGTPAGPWCYRRSAWAWHRRRSTRPGPGSPDTAEGSRLPGLLGATRLVEHTDPHARRFAVILDPIGLVTVIARCTADGPAMCDPSTVDTWVAGWARLLSQVAADPALVGLKAVVATRPDDGRTLTRSVHAARAPGGPQLAAAVLDEIAACYPTAATDATTWVEFTYRTNKFPGLRAAGATTREAAVAAELTRRIPGLLTGLAQAGAGTVTMATGADLIEAVRSAYDPTGARSADPCTDPATAWPLAGPANATEAWGHYEHDGAVSVTWALADLPRAPIGATAAAPLLGPLPELAGKRVALVLRPYTPARSARAAERDAATATFHATGGRGKGRVAAAGAARCRATEQTRHEIAAGAVLVAFQAYLTATVNHPTGLADAEAAVAAAAGAVPIRLTRCTGAQAAGFATTLPAGFLPGEHTVLPRWIKDLT
jgi:hypothetical protein